MTIRKEGNKYVLMSKSKGPDGKHKKLGTFDTRAEAVKREQQVEWFKHKGK